MATVGPSAQSSSNGNSGSVRLNDEIKRQIVGAVFFVGSAAAAVIVTRWILHENNTRYIRMRCAIGIQRYAHNRADWYRYVADKAGTYYNEMRDITV